MFLCSYALGQTSATKFSGLKFRQILPEDGLPTHMTYNAIEDKYGLIWVATSEGLCRFDGHGFRVFKHDPENRNSITNDHVRTLATDSKGNLWVGLLSHGLCRYNYHTGKFIRYRHDDKNPNSLVNDMVLRIFEDSQGNIWVGTEHGISVLEPETGRFTNYIHSSKDDSSIGEGGMISIAEDAKKRIWIATWNGGINLAVPNKEGGFSFRRFFPNNIPHFWALHLDAAGRFWVSTFGDGLLLMKTDDSQPLEKLVPKFVQFINNKEMPNSLSSNSIVDIQDDSQGFIWLSTTVGLNVFNPASLQPQSMSLEELETAKKSVKFKSFKHKYDAISTIPSPMVHGINIAKSGMMWACSSDGIAVFEPRSQAFWPIYFPTENIDEVMTFQAIEEDHQGRLWFGTEFTGLYIYNPITEQFSSMQELLPPKLCKALGRKVVGLHNQNNRFLYASCEAGFIRIDLKDYSFKTIVHKNDSLLDNGLSVVGTNRIYEDHKGNLWLCSNNGLFRYSPKNGKVAHWHTKSKGQPQLAHNILSGVVEDSNGDIWVSHHGGIEQVLMDANDDVTAFKLYAHDPNDPQSLLRGRTNSLCNVAGQIYIGTTTGICKMVGQGKFEAIKNGREPMGQMVNGMISGAGKCLWGTTNSAIFCYNIEHQRFYFFDKNYGLHGSDFALSNGCKTSAGDIIFYGISGATRFQEQQVWLNDNNKDVILTDLLVDQHRLDNLADPLEIKELNLDYMQNSLSFQFSSLDFMHPKEVSYAYMLKGFNKDWVYCGRHSGAVFSNLPGGDYVFQVKCTNGNGAWSDEATLQIPVHIALPYWETEWFYFLVLVAVFLVVYMFIRMRLKAISKRNKLLVQHNEALNREVTERKKVEDSLRDANLELSRSNNDLEQFAYIASHDLQEPLRMVGNFVQLLRRRYHDQLDEAGQQYIQYSVEGVVRMSELIQSLLTYSRVGRSEILLKEAVLKELMFNLLANLSKLIADKNVKITISELPASINCEPEQLGMVFHNLIINAIKFNSSSPPIIHIECKETPSYWLFSVQDNGIGIDNAYKSKIFEIFKRLHSRTEYEGTGIGLAICKRIVTRHGGEIWFESEPGKGTTFLFTISKFIESKNNHEMLENRLNGALSSVNDTESSGKATA